MYLKCFTQWKLVLTTVCLSSMVSFAHAVSYVISDPYNDVVGASYVVSASESETLLDIARQHDIGQEEIMLANPSIDRWLPVAGAEVMIPAQHIIPQADRKGLVLNLPEMRIYYFKSDKELVTYPVSVGRMDWKTPLGKAKIISKKKNPSWRPPKSVKLEAAQSGETVPDVVPPGPDNPLGEYALRLNLPGYLIHGTNKPYGVGMRVTHGCVRLLPEDIEALYGMVRVNTQVQLLNQPVKVGWHEGVLYLEVHPPMDEHAAAKEDLLQYALEVIYQELEKRPAALTGRMVRKAIDEQTGVPVAISKKTDEPPTPISSPFF